MFLNPTASYRYPLHIFPSCLLRHMSVEEGSNLNIVQMNRKKSPLSSAL